MIKDLRMEIIKQAFKRTFKDYNDMFKTHYPRASGGGLNEATQTYYFCKNLANIINENLCENKIKAGVSLELPVKNRKRIDGIVVSPESNEIFYIETKRLKGASKNNKKGILNDVNKIWENRDYIWENGIVINCEKVKTVEYIVILADMWIENRKQRREIPYWWAGTENKMIEEYFLKKHPFRIAIVDSVNKERFYEQEYTKKFDWDKNNQLIYRFYYYDKTKNSLQDYCLLCGYSKIPQNVNQ